MRRAATASRKKAIETMRGGFDADAEHLYVITTRTIESVVSTKEEIVN